MNAGREDGGSDLVAVCFLIHFRRRFALTPCSSASLDTRNPRFKAGRDKTLFRCRLVAPATVPANKPDPQFLIIRCHHKVSTYFGGHLMHQSSQKQKVRRNSRLRTSGARGLSNDAPRSPVSVVVPLTFASLLTGLIQSLGTAWGLLRHYWVLVKLAFTLFAAVVLLLKIALIDYAARLAAETALPLADLRKAGIQLVVHAAGGLLVLLVPLVLSIYKPQGMTRYGWRKQFRQRPSS